MMPLHTLLPLRRCRRADMLRAMPYAMRPLRHDAER